MPIEIRHRNGCTEKRSSKCPCKPRYRALVRVAGAGSRKLSETFDSKSEALAWEREKQTAKVKGQLVENPSEMTVERAGLDMTEGMESGAVLNRSGRPYKLNVAQQYRDVLANHVNPVIGSMRVVDVRRKDAQRVVNALMAKGLKPSTVRNALKPLQVLFRLALRDEIVTVNPTLDLELPRGTGKRERVASPAEAAALIEALRPEDRVLWGLAFYAGLRRGEIAALRVSDIGADEISVERSYDWRNREMTEVKTDAGKRRVPLLSALRKLLEAHEVSEGLICGATATRPFSDTNKRKRALTAWKHAKLTPISLHEARHTYASVLIAAGLDLRSVSTYLGHANIATTMDVYGHLLPGARAVDAAKVDAFLAV